MSLIDSINRINNTTITAQKKKEELKKIDKKINEALYNYFVTCFEEAGGGAESIRLALLENKKDKIKSLNFGIYNDFELSQKYDKILNQIYKTYKPLEKFHNISKKDLYIHLYNTLENEYKRLNLSAYDILNDYTLKENIIDKISRLYGCNNEEILYLKKEYQKINRLLYKEFKQYQKEDNQDEEEEEEKKHINYSYLFITIIKILCFPILLIVWIVLESGKRKRR